MSEDLDEPVLIVLDKEGYLVQAGDPKCLNKKDALRYAQSGYTMKTISIGEYRATKFNWIFDKPSTHSH